MKIQDWRETFGSEDVYELLTRLPARLMLDVGAAVGITTWQMLEKVSGGRVIAFEPFEGNWPHFERLHRDDIRVTLIKAAVAEHDRGGQLFVSSIINAVEGVWANYVGGSSAGRLVAEGGSAVPTCTLDDILGTRRATFLKIDVQGGEPGVLAGAERAFADRRIDLVYAEYTHTPEVLEIMERHGYRCFDGEYVLLPRANADTSAWDVHGEIVNSVGRTTLRCWPKACERDAAAWAAFLLDQKRAIGNLWTNLLFVAPGLDIAELAGARTNHGS